MKRVSLVLATKKLQRSSAVPPSFPIRVITLIALSLFSSYLFAQKTETVPTAEYRKVIHDRVVKIVNVLGITDSTKYNKVVETVSSQYIALNSIHENSKKNIDQVKSQTAADVQPEAIKKEEQIKLNLLKQQHAAFIAQLKKDLTEEQLEKVKDGMTYSVLKVTWTAYQDMIPTLKAEEKEKIYAWLVEAREQAMDAESSEKKHAVFGKYKGRINNYLSSVGYDMKKEEKAWQARIRERKQQQVEVKN